MIRLTATELFFRSPRPGEVGEPMDFIRVKDADMSSDEWERVLRCRPYLLNFGSVEVAVRFDKGSDPAVLFEVWRIGLAQPFKGPPGLVARGRLLGAKHWLKSNPALAVLFARAAQSAKPSRAGAKLLLLAEAALAAAEQVIH